MRTTRAAASPRPLVAAMLTALAVQLLLGMWVNLWVQVPARHAGAGAHNYLAGVGEVIAWALTDGAMMLRLHVAVGLLLLAGAILALVRGIQARRPAWIWSTALGLTGIIGAAFNGASFLMFNLDLSSYIMTAAFVVAAAAYTIGLAAGH